MSVCTPAEPADRPGLNWLLLPALLVALLVAQFAFKLALEGGPVTRIVGIPDECYANPSALLFPVDVGGGHLRWSTTGLVLTTVLDASWGAETTILVLASLLTAVSFATSWLAFRSYAFTLTFTLCMAFGTQFNYSWVNSSCSIYYLLVAYAQVNLLCLYLLFARPEWHPTAVRAGFFLSLVLFALCWETWLDYMVFLGLFSVAGSVLISRHRRPELAGAHSFVVLATAAVAVPYLITRMSVGGNHNEPGSECELLVNHPHVALMAEDFFSNALTYLYIALTTFVPPWPLGSHALVALGDGGVLDAQNRYGAASPHIVTHYHYLWHYQAGMAFMAFAVLSWKLAERAVKRPTAARAALAALCLLVWTGFSTHALIKFRFYLSVPALSYKVTISILGVALLLSLAVMLFVRKRPFTVRGTALVGLVWVILLTGAVTRPHWQATLLQRVGLETPPDPLARLFPAEKTTAP